MEKEKIQAVKYICGYKQFNKNEQYDWTSAIWNLFNARNMYSHGLIINIDVGQFGQDKNGWYENYVQLIVNKNSRINWDEYLSDLGYGFTKHDITIMKYIVDYDENIDEVIIEID